MVRKKNNLGTYLAGILVVLVVLGVAAWLMSSFGLI
jgi:hypothetical protein